MNRPSASERAEKLALFSKAMQREMDANTHKPGWEAPPDTPPKLHAKLLIADAAYHLAKFARAVYEDEQTRAVEHAADVANCAWIALDAVGLLTDAAVTARQVEPDDAEHGYDEAPKQPEGF